MAKSKKQRRLFLSVDVWRATFGPVSVTAIYDVFQQKFGIEKHNMKNYSFSHCVEALRKLEDPNYKTGDLALSKPNDIEVEYTEVIAEDNEQ